MKWIKKIVQFLNIRGVEKKEEVVFTETPLDRIKRIQQGISREEAEEMAKRGPESSLQKAHRLRAQKTKPEPWLKIETVDTSKLKNLDLITFTKKNHKEEM